MACWQLAKLGSSMRFVLPWLWGWSLLAMAMDCDDFINEALRRFEVPGAAVLVIKDGQVVHTAGYGYRDLEAKLPVTEQTLFQIGSVTKSFTAMLLQQLAEEGKLSLDDPVRNYLPSLRFNDENDVAAKLTLRDLLAHRTGLSRHDPIWICREIRREQVIEILRHLAPASGDNLGFMYNNFMYAVLGLVIERVTGLPWEEAVRVRLFQPLHMHRSNCSLKELHESKDYALPYALVNGQIQRIPFRNSQAVAPGGSINSSVTELAAWVKVQLGERALLISQKGLDEMHQIQIEVEGVPAEEGAILGYGLGWFVGTYQGRTLISHGGSIDGFSTNISLLPAEGIGIVVLTNSSSDGMYLIAAVRNHLFDQLLGEPVDWLTRKEEQRRQAREGWIKKEEAVQDTNLDEYVGPYHHPAYGKLDVALEEEHLVLRYGTLVMPLKAVGQDRFSGELYELLIYGVDPIAHIEFFRRANSQIERIEVPFEGFRHAEPIPFQRT